MSDTKRMKSLLIEALCIASKTGDIEKVKSLVKMGVNINSENDSGDLPLNLASEAGQLEMVKLLVASGGSVNQGCEDMNNTPLWHACMKGHMKVVKFLLSAGASPNILNCGNQGPLYLSLIHI